MRICRLSGERESEKRLLLRVVAVKATAVLCSDVEKCRPDPATLIKTRAKVLCTSRWCLPTRARRAAARNAGLHRRERNQAKRKDVPLPHSPYQVSATCVAHRVPALRLPA